MNLLSEEGSEIVDVKNDRDREEAFMRRQAACLNMANIKYR